MRSSFYITSPTCVAVRAVTHVVADSVVTCRSVLTWVGLTFVCLYIAAMAFVAIRTEAVKSTENGGTRQIIDNTYNNG